MAYVNTEAMVLRSTDWRENDRIVTLLTQARGRVEAVMRGCRKPKSSLMAASQLFTLGEYVLFKGKGHEMVVNCEIKDSFYPLRNDYDKFCYASIILSCADIAAQLEEPQNHLLILLTRTLSRLSYTDLDAREVTAAYLLHFLSLIGYKPRLNHCSLCHEAMGVSQPGWLDAREGGLMCKNCLNKQSAKMKLESDAINWLRQVLAHGVEKTQEKPHVIPLEQLWHYAEQVLERPLPKLPEQASLL